MTWDEFSKIWGHCEMACLPDNDPDVITCRAIQLPRGWTEVTKVLHVEVTDARQAKDPTLPILCAVLLADHDVRRLLGVGDLPPTATLPTLHRANI